jgi:hypothetical protein
VWDHLIEINGNIIGVQVRPGGSHDQILAFHMLVYTCIPQVSSFFKIRVPWIGSTTVLKKSQQTTRSFAFTITGQLSLNRCSPGAEINSRAVLTAPSKQCDEIIQ